MKRIYLCICLLSLFACRKIEIDGDGGTIIPPNGSENVILEGRIKEDRTLKSNFTYKLRGLVYVTNNATLTIEPGTKIVGELSKQGGLIITRNCKIIADGTRDKPIIFTSEASSPSRGDWTGLVLLGNAPTNSSYNGVQGVGSVEGGINNSDDLGLYGTPINQTQKPEDNSGILRYVKIEYAGAAFLPDNEINGLTLAGIGSKTIIDYIQVSYAADDSFEWFGGTVNCKHLISYKTLDDDFDTDNGYSGRVQFGIAMRDSSVADISKANGFESDNDGIASSTTPHTKAIFSNMTIIGPKATLDNIGNSNFFSGIQVRRNTSQSIFNSVIMGWNIGLFVDASTGIATDLNITNSTLFIQNNIISGCKTPIKYTPNTRTPTSFDIDSWFYKLENNNKVFTTNNEVKFSDPFNYSTPNFNPQSNSIILTSASFLNPLLNTFFTPVSYCGAASENDDWWKDWTNF